LQEKNKNDSLIKDYKLMTENLAQAKQLAILQAKEIDEDYKKQIFSLQQKLKEVERMINEKNKEETQKMLSEHLSSIEKLNKKLDVAQTELSQKIIQAGNMAKEKEQLVAKLEALNKNKEVIAAEVNFVKKKLQETEGLLTSKIEQEEPLRSKLKELQDSIKNTQDLIALESSEEAVKSALAEKIQEIRLPLQEKIFSLEKKLDLIKIELEKKEQEIKSLKSEKR
jgi:chromosome segregation ATPase